MAVLDLIIVSVQVPSLATAALSLLTSSPCIILGIAFIDKNISHTVVLMKKGTPVITLCYFL